MVLSYALIWLPVFGTTGESIGNTIWCVAWAVVFFATYTMNLIAFYGSLSTVCTSQTQRIRVSSYKSFFDTIGYCIVYAAIPGIMGALRINVQNVAFILLPLMVTMVIPLFMIKEGKKWEPEGYVPEEEKQVGFWESLKICIKSKPFMAWLAVNCCAFFGLQLFLSAQNTLISGVMGLGAGWAALLNTCAFAPVPIMLYLFQKLKKKKGTRFTYQTCLLSFAVCILGFDLGGAYLWPDSIVPRLIIGAVAGVFGSWAIGAFFMMPYLVPTEIASEEQKLTGLNHSAMYFAVQALATSIVGAISGNLIYDFLKQWTSVDAVGTELKLGVSLIPVIVSVFCIAGFFLCFMMPKDYSRKYIAKSINAEDKLDTLAEEELEDVLEKKVLIEEENMIVNVAITILSGFLFCFGWIAFAFNKIKKLAGEAKSILPMWLLSIIPLVGAVAFIINEKKLVENAKKWGIELKNKSILYAILSLLWLPGIFVILVIMQIELNRVAKVIREEAVKTIEVNA